MKGNGTATAEVHHEEHHAPPAAAHAAAAHGTNDHGHDAHAHDAHAEPKQKEGKLIKIVIVDQDIIQVFLGLAGVMIQLLAMTKLPHILGILDFLAMPLVAVLVLLQFFEFGKGEGNWFEAILTTAVVMLYMAWGREFIPQDVSNLLLLAAYIGISLFNLLFENLLGKSHDAPAAGHH